MDKINSRYLLAFFFQMLFLVIINAQDITSEITHVCDINNPSGVILLSVSDIGDETPPPYHFVWKDEINNIILDETNQDGISELPNLSPGEYCVEVINGDGCRAAGCFVIENLTDPDFAIQTNSIDCICQGGEAVIDITVLGDSGPYTYIWTGDGVIDPNVEDATVTESGIYSIEVINAYGCIATQSINVPACGFDFSNFTVTTTNSCQGPGTGSIELNINEIGLAPYSFIWSDLDGTTLLNDEDNETGISTITGLVSGEYCVTAFSANACQASICNMVIDGVFEAPGIDYIISPESTSGAGDGAIELLVSGGSNPPFSFEWNNGANTQNISGLASGTYTVEVVYALGGCNLVLDIYVPVCNEALDDLSLSAIIDPMSSGDANDASIDLTVEGGEDYAFQYFWQGINSNMEYNTEDISPLGHDTYCVTVTNISCPAFQLTECFEICDLGFNIELSKFQQCNHTTATAVVDGTNGPYTYIWSNGGTFFSTLVAYNQEYCVTVTDNTGCQAVKCISANPPPLTLDLTVNHTTLGEENGSITAMVNGGFPPYTYAWSTGETLSYLRGLNVGSYCVTVTDNCGNTIMDCGTVECEISTDQVNVQITNVSCANQSGGAIDLNLFSATNNVYTWDNGASTQDITGLNAGKYCVTIVNTPTNCIYMDCYTVGTSGLGDFEITLDIIPTCDATGGAAANVDGGIEPYTYTWWKLFSPFPFQSGSAETVENISVGWYSVWVKDAMDCSNVKYFYMGSSGGLIDFDIIVNPNSVCEGETASASVVNITGGTGTYTYEWRKLYEVIPGNQTATNLEPATYFVTVFDDEGCKREKAFHVAQYTPISLESELNHICLGENTTGSIEISPIGGASPYVYLWDNGANTATIQNLNAGTYTLTVTNNNGCSLEETYTVVASNTPSVEAELIQPICAEDANGSIQLTPLTTDTPYTYNWSNGNTTNAQENLGQGSYTVTLTNIYGCTGMFTYDLVSLSNLEIIVNNINPTEGEFETGDDLETGSVSVSATGGVGPFSYFWTGPNGFVASGANISNLMAGTYTVNVTDAYGCQESLSINICLSPDPPYAYIEPFTTQNCVGTNKGSITGLQVQGGTSPFTYEWSGPEGFHSNNSQITGLDVEGTYCVTVTDACYQASTVCVPMRCNCDIEVGYSLDLCEDGGISIGLISPTEQQYKVRIFSEDLQLDEEFVAYMGTGGVTMLPNSQGVTQNGIYAYNLSSGLYTVEISGEYGCWTTDSYIVLEENTQIYYLYFHNFWGPNTAIEDQVLALGYDKVISSCASTSYCLGGGLSSQHELLNYVPNDTNYPCSQGGQVYCSYCNDDSGNEQPCFEVPPNTLGLQLTGDGECACLFPPGVIEDEGFYNMAGIGFLNNDQLFDIWEDPTLLYYEYGCNGSVTENSPDCPCETECIYTPAGDCTYDVFCTDNPNLPIDNIDAGSTFCLLPGGNSLNILKQCNSDPCVFDVVFSCDISTEENCREEELNDALFFNGYTGDYIYCEDEANCLPEIASLFSACSQCQGILLPFISTDEEITPNDQGKGSVVLLLEKTEKIIETLQVKIYPNPFDNTLSVGVKVPETREVNIIMTDVVGRIILSQSYIATKGSSTIELLNIPDLQVGIYLLHTRDAQGNLNIQKVVHQTK